MLYVFVVLFNDVWDVFVSIVNYLYVCVMLYSMRYCCVSVFIVVVEVCVREGVSGDVSGVMLVLS